MDPGLQPEQRARVRIDRALGDAGWIVQNRSDVDLTAGPGVAVRPFRYRKGWLHPGLGCVPAWGAFGRRVRRAQSEGSTVSVDPVRLNPVLVGWRLAG